MTITNNTTTTVQLPTGIWNIDPSHSSLEFSVRHLMISKVKGSFSTFAGTVTVPEDPYQASLSVTIDPTSIETGDAARDTHLRSGDFFEVEKYPEAGYVSTAVRAAGDGYVVEGDLTLHGVTRPVALALDFNGVGGDPWGNTRAGVQRLHRDQPAGLRHRHQHADGDRRRGRGRQDQAQHRGRTGPRRFVGCRPAGKPPSPTWPPQWWCARWAG